jgi:hypothetical protein
MIVVARMILMIIVVVMIVMTFMIVVGIIVVVMTFMIIMVVVMILVVVMTFMIIVASMFIMNMDLSIKVFRFPPNQRGSYRSLNGYAAAGIQAPLEDTTKQSIKGVMPWGVVKVRFKPPMSFNCYHRSEFKLTGLRCISTAAMVAVSESWPGLNQWQKQ